MEDLKLIYEILNMAWKIIRDYKSGKTRMTDAEWVEMGTKANETTKELEQKYGLDERKLFSALYHDMADYIGKKEKNGN